MSSPRYYYPRTLEEAARDIKEWTAHKTRYPEHAKQGGVIFSERLMQDICNRILLIERKAAGHD